MSSLKFLMSPEENIEGFVVDPETLEMSDLETVEAIAQYIIKQLNNDTTNDIDPFDHSEGITQGICV